MLQRRSNTRAIEPLRFGTAPLEILDLDSEPLGVAPILHRPDRMTEDFTNLPLGSLVSSQRPVIRCPSCQRHGALERGDDGMRRCVHVEVSSFAANRLQTSQTDVCQIAGPRPESFAESVLTTAS